ncbi:death domain-containing protein 1-like [Ptychodera flava]|uniref:death domain-containing protein 1-like n=1 Tax=Ptychodera flava TaxID=63121 RepID=UPI00396A9367
MEQTKENERKPADSSSGSESESDGSSGESGTDSNSSEGEKIATSVSVSPKDRPSSAASSRPQSAASQRQITNEALTNYTETLSGLSDRIRTQNKGLTDLDDIRKYDGDELRKTLEETRRVLQASGAQAAELTRNIADIREVMTDLKTAMQDKLNKYNIILDSSQTEHKKSSEECQADALVAAACAGLAKATAEVAEAIKSAAEAENRAAEAAVVAQAAAEESQRANTETSDAVEKVKTEEEAAEEDGDKETENAEKKEEEDQEEQAGDEESGEKDGNEKDTETVTVEDVEQNDEETVEEKRENGDKEDESSSSGSGSGSSSSGSDSDSSDEGKNDKDDDKVNGNESNEAVDNGVSDSHDDDTASTGSFERTMERRMSKLKDEPNDEIIYSPLYKYYVLPNGNEESELGCILRAKQVNFTQDEVKAELANHLSGGAVGENEELVSHVIEMQLPDDKKLTTPVNLAIPYVSTARPLNAREAVVKTTTDGREWKVIPTTSTEGTLTDQKKMFAEVKVSELGAFAVVARWTKDRVTVTKKGGVLKSSVDSRVFVSVPQGACGLTSISLQVQPVELTAVSDLKSRLGHCADLITSSPILHFTHTSKKEFAKPVTIMLPLPPNPTKETKQHGRPSTAAKDVFSRPASGFVIRPRSAKLFGSDHSDDVIHVLSRNESGNALWNLMDVRVKQARKDVVSFDITKPVDRIIAVRYAAQSTLPIEQMVHSLEDSLQLKYACVILHHKTEDPEQVIVQVVQSRYIDSTERKLIDKGYEAPPEPSHDIAMSEGQNIRIKFTGNIEVIGDSNLSLNFHAQRKNILEFSIKEANKYGNYSQPFYRGVAEFYGKPRVTLEDKGTDPFEADKEAKDTKKDAKEAKKAREAREQKEKETKEKSNKELMCKLAVVLPKGEPEPLRPPSRYRATALEAEDPSVSNDSLRWVASELGHEWETLAAYLGIKRSRLQSIQRNNPNDMQQQSFDALITWRSSLPRSYNKLPKLARALTRCGRYDIAEELLAKSKDRS